MGLHISGWLGCSSSVVGWRGTSLMSSILTPSFAHKHSVSISKVCMHKDTGSSHHGGS